MKILAVLSAGLGDGAFQKYARSPLWKQLKIRSLESALPALTCPAQAAFRTASGVPVHGMGASGYYDRTLRKPFFWEQSGNLYEGKRIWEDFRTRGGKVGQICLQQCPGPESDVYLSPAPIHKHHGGMIQDFLSEPEDLYRSICAELGKKFNLMDYWGPFPSLRGTQWIARAAAAVLRRASFGPDAFLMTYLPHLDYAFQKFGPESKEAARAFAEYESELENLVRAARENHYEILILGDYEITRAETAVFPNRILAERGYLRTRTVGGMLYMNLHSSRAFALCDHQICHIYAGDPKDAAELQTIFRALPGVDSAVLRENTPGWNHPRCGELILTAAPGAWFAYPYWTDDRNAPDFARHVDIHNKPGFDPLELYWKLWPPMSVPLDTSLLRGTHGRPCSVVCGSTFEPDSGLRSFTDAARQTGNMLSASR